MANETLLVISGDGMPPYAVRGISQTLEPIDAAKNLKRTVNGGLIDLSASQFKKYRSTISCEDIDSPAFDAVEIGDTLTIDCVAELAFKSGGSPAATPSRTPVQGSERTANSFTFYRPQLVMKVVNKSQETDEYGAAVNWSLELEEI
jgi:hypothetical protein